ncbi:MAG: 2-oxoacid:acceptor oxidoreductase family protein [Lachnoclostridium sp.]|nr:2-oxoacid:acceptor oxidoreductase family protein [Lachnoclostridium sp.]
MNKIIIAGYGGQGMLLCGQMLAYAAMKDGYHVTWLPSYGPEMRGGAASCSVVISKNPIGSPVIQFADAVVAVSQPAYEKYRDSVKEGGFLIYHSALVKLRDKKPGVQYIGIDFTELAAELKNPRTANMIVLGSINEVLHCVHVSALFQSIQYKFGIKKAELVKLNEEAVELGIKAVK